MKFLILISSFSEINSLIVFISIFNNINSNDLKLYTVKKQENTNNKKDDEKYISRKTNKDSVKKVMSDILGKEEFKNFEDKIYNFYYCYHKIGNLILLPNEKN